MVVLRLSCSFFVLQSNPTRERGGHGCAAHRFSRLRVGLRVPHVVRAERVDLLEQPTAAGPVTVDDGVVELDLGPFELVSLRLRG